MEEEIGVAAGTIWQCLNEHGAQSLAKLKRETKLSDHLLLMAVGWLAREAKVNVVRSKQTLNLSLKEGR